MYVCMCVYIYICIYVGNVYKTEVRAASLEEWFSALPGTPRGSRFSSLTFRMPGGRKEMLPTKST